MTYLRFFPYFSRIEKDDTPPITVSLPYQPYRCNHVVQHAGTLVLAVSVLLLARVGARVDDYFLV